MNMIGKVQWKKGWNDINKLLNHHCTLYLEPACIASGCCAFTVGCSCRHTADICPDTCVTQGVGEPMYRLCFKWGALVSFLYDEQGTAAGIANWPVLDVPQLPFLVKPNRADCFTHKLQYGSGFWGWPGYVVTIAMELQIQRWIMEGRLFCD